MTDDRAPTHTAFALRREGKTKSRWLEIGKARLEPDGKVMHLFLDRTPIGGFNGYVCISPIGVKLQEPDALPERPGDEGAL